MKTYTINYTQNGYDESRLCNSLDELIETLGRFNRYESIDSSSIVVTTSDN